MLVSKQKINAPCAQKRNRKSMNRLRQQQGFTLMEVMLAAFVLAVGMLGSTAMMLRGTQQADSTNHESMAAQSAINMAERMRSNIRGQGKAGTLYDNLAANKNNVVDCKSTCTLEDVALYHAYIWGLELDESFPNANPAGLVEALNPTKDDAVFKITVNWDGFKRTSTTTANNVTNSYVMIFQP